MSMGTRETDRASFGIAASGADIPGAPVLCAIERGPGCPRLRPVRGRSVSRIYAKVMGWPGLPPGQCFRLLLVGYDGTPRNLSAVFVNIAPTASNSVIRYFPDSGGRHNRC